mmetsp:Transcript_14642/g.24826  ORF Transcript_14642/g.24826 Transcript_14642/m.24826 type:complete len:323 (-) Transcript_14642:12-980(-)
MTIATIRLNDPDVEGLVEALRSACVNVGFFYLEGHGVDEEVFQKVKDQTRALFRLPQDQKRALSDPVLNRGYTAMGEETLDPARQKRGDTKEGFYIGKDVRPDSDEYNPAKLAGPNVWPSKELSPSFLDSESFKETMQLYMESCMSVAFRLVQLIALAIGVDEHFFDAHFENPLSTIRLLHYSKERSVPEDGVFACGAHTDYGMITLLLTDSNEGLQVLTKENVWLDVPPRPSAFVVNLGDMLERWTNGMFRSTLHRVLTSGSSERYSIPFFYEPHFDTEVEVLDVCCSPSNPPKYPPTTSGQHLLDKYKETHADFQPKEEG